jgi:hypothetical protein
MSKQTLTTALLAIALVVPLAGQKAKVPKPPPPAYVSSTFELEVNSGGSTVEVGRDVRTYGPIDQVLYIHDSLLPPDGTPDISGGISLVKAAPHNGDFWGPYYGQIRVLDDRVDYFFDTAMGCVADNAEPNLCPFRLAVVDGEAVKIKKKVVGVAFDEGRYLLDYRPCDPALDPDCYINLYGCYDDRDCPGVPPGGEGYVYATLNVWFR